MFSKIKNNQTFKALFDSQNLGLYALVLVALSVTWSSVKIIQKNYDLEKSITTLQQEVAVLDQQTQNQKIINQYYKTDDYLDFAARKYFSKAAPGEKLIVVPQEVAEKYVNKTVAQASTNTVKKSSNVLTNFKAWGDFLSHKQPSR